MGEKVKYSGVDRRTALLGIGGCALGMGVSSVLAADQVQVMVGFPAGGITDLLGRVFAEHVLPEVDRIGVVVNRPGAAGLIAMQAVVQSRPDGSVAGIGGLGTVIITPLTKKDIPFDPVRELAFVSNLGSFGYLFVARADAPFSNWRELVAYSKSQPGGVNCGAPPVGSPAHLLVEYLKREAGLQANLVSYSGDAPTVTDILGGHLTLGFVTAPGATPHLEAKSIKALGITTASRASKLPDIPTLQEQGVRNFSAPAWTGLFMRSGTPAQFLRAVNAAVNKTFVTPAVKARLATLGVDFTPMDNPQADAFLRMERVKWKAMADRVGIVPT